MRTELPCLPLIQERFWNVIKGDLTKEDKKYYPEFELTMFLQTWGSTALGFGGIGGVAYTKTIGKAQNNAEREVFKETVVYTEQAASFLAKSYKEYNDAETDADKNIIMEYVVMRYPNLDTDSIENSTLRQFYIKCLNN